MLVRMFAITVCALVLFATNDVQGRYVFEPTLHGSIETNKIISTFQDAVSQCKTEGAVLAAPLNQQLRNEMMALIGVNNHSTPYFINAKLVHSHKLQFVSSEGVSLDAMSVSDMIEELDPRDGQCLAMDSRTIRVVSCSAPLPYMCYKENDASVPVGVAVARTIPPVPEIYESSSERILALDCGPNSQGYHLDRSTGSCYKIQSDAVMTWDDADSTCRSEGGHLVVLNDEHEARVVQAFDAPGSWIGIRDFHNNNIWTSVEGKSMSELYNVWHNGHNPYTDLDCGTINIQGKLDDYTCDTKRNFICEKNPRIL
ncbi:macrophage mannose receptor 1-like isoform X2 [Anticarsia gemmatalis]|uniref:macrophage mannose receptor 1-like isoform X2 n=1 Tax=Anticarsia gemmatalis TaxID=129554 RepID=UPI003F757B12